MLPRISDFTIPMIEERIGNTIRVYDIFSLLNKERIVMIGTPIMDYTAAVVVAQLIYLEKEDKEKPIWMYINSPGGDITAGLAIRDTMKFIKCPVRTIGFGQCASMAAVLLAAGQKGERMCLPSTRVLIHQPWSGGGGGQQSDVVIQAKELTRMRDALEKMLAQDTGQPIEKVHQDCDRDFIMEAEEAKTYGIVDKVIDKRP
jgi:ATP-dependent Clp protease, protease subunit